MNLSAAQIEKTFQVWKYYIENGVTFLNNRGEFNDAELDQKRLQLIPEIQALLFRYHRGDLELSSFKTKLDSLNKKNRLWGFMAINGQMFFNMVVKSSQSGNKTQELNNLLRKVMLIPPSINEVQKRIQEFEEFVRDLGQFSSDPRGAPKVGSIPYFLSYLWQIQDPEKYPIYYTSMVQAFKSLDIWSPSKNAITDYVEFFDLNYLLVEKLSQKYNRKIKLWDVEHAFWLQFKIITKKTSNTSILPVLDFPQPVDQITEPVVMTLPESYVPPIVSVLPMMAKNDPEMIHLCRQSGRAIE